VRTLEPLGAQVHTVLIGEPELRDLSVAMVKTPVLAGDALESNNRQVFTLKVIRDRVRVLHVCGRPSWSERFLRSLLPLDANVDLVSFFILRTDTDEMPLGAGEMSLIPFPYKEIFDEQLTSFDLLIFDNFNFKPYWVEPYLAGVRACIEPGGAPPTNNGRNDQPEQERQSADLRPSGSWCRARTTG
jgi:hypothetical protein